MAYRLARAIAIFLARVVFALCGGIRAGGWERVPRTGALIVAPNHISDSDPIAVGVMLPRPAWFMGKSELFEIPILKSIARLLHGFPVRRGKPDRQALHRAEELLKQGEALVIFPEGRLSETGELQDLNPGVVMIAMRTGAPILPVGLIGTNRVVPFGKRRPRRAAGGVTVRFGVPIPVEELTGGQTGRAGLEHGLTVLEKAIRDLSQPVPAPSPAGLLAGSEMLVP